MSFPLDLAESLAWLDYCLGETLAAMEAVKAAAAGGPPAPGIFIKHDQFLRLMVSYFISLKGRCRNWAAVWSGDG